MQSKATRERSNSAKGKKDLERPGPDASLPNIATSSLTNHSVGKVPDHGTKHSKSKRDLEGQEGSSSQVMGAVSATRSGMITFYKNPFLTSDNKCPSQPPKRILFDEISDALRADPKLDHEERSPSPTPPRKGKRKHQDEPALPMEAFFGFQKGRSTNSAQENRSPSRSEGGKKKPRKFLMKLNNSASDSLSSPPAYTPRLYGSKPRDGATESLAPVMEGNKRLCPVCKLSFHPSLGQNQIENHIQMHRQYSQTRAD